MLTQDLKSKIDKLWNTFWGNGISDPLTAIEQINYLIFMKRLDDIDKQSLIKANRIKTFEYNSLFAGSIEINGRVFEKDTFRWSHWTQMSADEMFVFVKDIVFPFIKNIDESIYADNLKDAVFMIPNASLLVTAVSIIEDLKITEQNEDTSGDIYEYLLNEISAAGKGGAFRTPRHIIEMMIEIVNPTKNDKIADPACGTAGFLINTYKHIIKENTSKDGSFSDDFGTHYTADMFSNEDWKRVKENTLFGYDFSTKMVRVGMMNSILHGITTPNITYTDTLGKNFDHKEEWDIVLANPPFKGSILKNNIHPDFKVETTKTELLFLELIYDKLFVGGKCAVIIPDGVLFGSSNAHKKVRELIIENTGLKAVISLPGGVFKPYAGVSTAILIFTKGDETNNVWFYDLEADGFSLDDKRNKIDINDIPDCKKKYKDVVLGRKYEEKPKKEDKWFWVSKDEIKENKYDLSISKYKKIEYTPVDYEKPEVLINDIRKLEKEIIDGIDELEKMI
ncbi:MAG: class I SAM-dependent DNA methyltransferase [Candidatus Gracilibacteria bacterium]|nr:class I SAM-dependent DNA methyltransferase [Candidatus Gracilibacteria bacterium]